MKEPYGRIFRFSSPRACWLSQNLLLEVFKVKQYFLEFIQSQHVLNLSYQFFFKCHYKKNHISLTSPWRRFHSKNAKVNFLWARQRQFLLRIAKMIFSQKRKDKRNILQRTDRSADSRKQEIVWHFIWAKIVDSTQNTKNEEITRFEEITSFEDARAVCGHNLNLGSFLRTLSKCLLKLNFCLWPKTQKLSQFFLWIVNIVILELPWIDWKCFAECKYGREEKWR